MALFGPEQYAILGSTTVERTDLPELIDRAERAVLGRYTEGTGDAAEVKLGGYDPDPALCEADLLTRLRYVVADVVEHWISMPDMHVESMSRGARSVSFREVIETMPRGSFRLLEQYDLREPVWRV